MLQVVAAAEFACEDALPEVPLKLLPKIPIQGEGGPPMGNPLDDAAMEEL